MTSRAKNRRAERLGVFGIKSGRQLADWVEAPAVIYFLTREASGNRDRIDYRTELHYGELSKETPGLYSNIETFRSSLRMESISTIRHLLLEDAFQFAEDKIDISPKSWSRTPFTSCWLPRESVMAMRQMVEGGIDLP